MTNKEKYKRTFSALHASEIDLEELKMNRRKKIRISKKLAGFLAAAVIMTAGTTAAYAADIGGIQQKMHIWLSGRSTEADVQIQQQGNVTTWDVTYTDENGEVRHMCGGGVAGDANGNYQPIPVEYIMEEINSNVFINHQSDGTVMIYFKDQSKDITNDFDEDGYCFVSFEDGGVTEYITVYPDGCYGMNTTGFDSKE